MLCQFHRLLVYRETRKKERIGYYWWMIMVVRWGQQWIGGGWWCAHKLCHFQMAGFFILFCVLCVNENGRRNWVPKSKTTSYITKKNGSGRFIYCRWFCIALNVLFATLWDRLYIWVCYVRNLGLKYNRFRKTCSIIINQYRSKQNIEHDYDQIYTMFDLSKISIVWY